MVHRTASDIHQLRRLLSGDADRDDYADCCERAARLWVDLTRRPSFVREFPHGGKLLADTLAKLPGAFDQISVSFGSKALAMGTLPIWLWCRPEWVMPLGFDEMRFHSERVFDPSVSDSSAGFIEDAMRDYLQVQKGTDSGGRVDSAAICQMLQLVMQAPQFRSKNGQWHDFEYLMDKALPPELDENRKFDEWVGLLRDSWISRLNTAPLPAEAVIYMPALHTPLSRYPDLQLTVAVKDILQFIAEERTALVDLPWRTLEEIVAELLHDMGLQVELTPRSHDGGRDVIARGELIPGEPTVLAIEVKQRKVVPVSELRSALWANRDFPALLFATSGRFSAGVYEERSRRDNMLRLYLKDGVALQQWIDSYAKRHGLTTR